MKEQVRKYLGYRIYLTPEDQSLSNPDVWSWTGKVFDNIGNIIYSHYFTIDDVLWGGYTVDYMFQRVIFDLDRLMEVDDL